VQFHLTFKIKLYTDEKNISISLLVLFFLQYHQLFSQNPEMFFKAAGSPANPRVQASWNKYYTYDGISDLCKKLAREYPDLVTMESAGKSYKGRDIIALTITDKNTRIHLKPGFYIDEYTFKRDPGNRDGYVHSLVPLRNV
jgi:hypothetical protein